MKKKQFVTFWLDEYHLGIDILVVREINRMLDVTEVPHTPMHILGLINLRGQTVTVFDLGIRLGLKPRIITDDSHNIILKIDAVGLLVDKIGDVISVENSRIASSPPNTGGIESGFILGVIEQKEDLVMILNPKKILEVGSNESTISE